MGGVSSVATPTASSGPYDYYARYSKPTPVTTPTAPPTATPTVQSTATSSVQPLYKPISSRGNSRPDSSPSRNGLRETTPTDHSLNRRSGKPTDLSSMRKVSDHTPPSLGSDLIAGDSSSSLGTGSDSDMLQMFTEELANFSKTGVFSDSSLLSDMGALLGTSSGVG